MAQSLNKIYIHLIFHIKTTSPAIRQFLLSYSVEYDEAYVFKDEGFCPYRARRLYYAEPQGVASLALGYVLHWAFSPSLLNPELELLYNQCRDGSE